ncbi:MAG: cupin domain-containing protein [Eubacteriaceae bacterium]|nr:cupin domain-containing protein [Eubacteriaceae bacterium]
MIDNKSYIVKTGETIYPSTIPHTLKNPFDEELEVISILTPTIF